MKVYEWLYRPGEKNITMLWSTDEPFNVYFFTYLPFYISDQSKIMKTHADTRIFPSFPEECITSVFFFFF